MESLVPVKLAPVVESVVTVTPNNSATPDGCSFVGPMPFQVVSAVNSSAVNGLIHR